MTKSIDISLTTDEYLVIVNDVVRARVEECNISHPSDIAIQYSDVNEILDLFLTRAIKATLS